MKLSLSGNICKLRKAHSMTQEQLAEALGVTFASVSKWERGVATPELSLIAEMADLFGVSLDALVGFEAQSGNVAALQERIQQLGREKKYDEAITEAEKALLRYPNDFRIVYHSGELYAFAGIEQNKENYLHRGIELLEHSTLLISQNTVEDISEVSIQNIIAQCYIFLDKTEKGIEILKKYNVCGVHNAMIAVTYATKPDFNPKDVEPFMMGALGGIVTSLVRTMLAYANYYFKLGNYELSRTALIWLAETLENLKQEPNTVAYVDKIIAPCYSQCANLSLFLGETDKATPYLYRAYQIAKTFDAAPTYKFHNIRFCVGDIEKMTAYDDLGESVIATIDRQMMQEDCNETLPGMWERIKEETGECTE